MARAGQVLAATLDLVQENISARASRRARASSTRSPTLHPLTGRRTDLQGLSRKLSGLDPAPRRDSTIVHGIPGKSRAPGRPAIASSIHARVMLDGRGSRTQPAPSRSGEYRRGSTYLLDVTEGRCWLSPGRAWGNPAWATSRTRSRRSPRARYLLSCACLWATRVGRSTDEDPAGPQPRQAGKGPLSRRGWCWPIEPMTTSGRPGGSRRLVTGGRSTARTARRRRISSHGRDYRRRPKMLMPWQSPAAEAPERGRSGRQEAVHGAETLELLISGVLPDGA